MATSADGRTAPPRTSASGERLRVIEAGRREMRQTFVQRFWLRWHMALMLSATVGAGFAANKLMLLIPVHGMPLRWVLALCVSYLALAAVAVMLGGMVYLVVGAPAMLADTAFSAMLAGGLVRHVRRMDESDWEGSVFRSTWKPFLGVMVMAIVTGEVAHYVVPGARTLGEVLMLYR